LRNGIQWLYIKGKDAVIYDPSFSWKLQSGQIPKVSYASGRSVLVALFKMFSETWVLEPPQLGTASQEPKIQKKQSYAEGRGFNML
jgi:hypothetical protein